MTKRISLQGNIPENSVTADTFYRSVVSEQLGTSQLPGCCY